MKKLLGLILFFTGLGIVPGYSANPIPSYNVPVYHTANFQEARHAGGITSVPSRGERQMVVKVKGSSSSVATVWVYSLDLQDILGPYTVYGGETIYVDIDEREWGVIVQSEDHVEVDVWIEEG